VVETTGYILIHKKNPKFLIEGTWDFNGEIPISDFGISIENQNY